MQAHARLVSAGLALYAGAWFVQVVRDGATLADGVLPGWQALRAALSPIWPYEDLHLTGSVRRILSVSSGCSNLVVLCLPWWLRLARRGRTALAAGPLLVAAAVDAHWMLASVRDLRWGYFLWLASFLVLAVGVARGGRGRAG